MGRPSSTRPGIASQLLFSLYATATFIALFSLLRLALLAYNRDQIGGAANADLVEAFANGLRFDLRAAVIICAPLLLALLSARLSAARIWQRIWLTVAASLCLLLGLSELDFYREFHQRLNGLVFQYLQEDMNTVLSMLWNGFPVGRYLLACLLATLGLWWLFRGLDRLSRVGGESPSRGYQRGTVFVVCLLIAVVAARGHLRQGPPLRWGDAYTTDSMFANHLGLNGILTLVDAAKNTFSSHRDNAWKATMDDADAQRIVRDMLLTRNDRLVDADRAAVRRISTPAPKGTLPAARNVVVILLESFSGRHVGALGDTQGITPNFDRLAKEGLLFTRFFSNGTHTHQGMFATMACFPNLPGFEYLMRTPEGSHAFSGLPQQLSARDYQDVYVYNGNFQWDNQSGFFSNQGMRRFVGREDFVNPVFMDPTWGVSDQDMFDRGAEELLKLDPAQPFYALLQSLSNHTPYALPDPLPVEPVMVDGQENRHLTAMRYADWALGQFFEKARKAPYFKDTLFVVVGDHGFGAPEQLTEMDLYRFNVPLLLIGPGIQEKFGTTEDRIGTQLDVVPTIMARLGGETRQQCWGRDLLGLPQDDPGTGVIKPSGSDQTVAILRGDQVLVQPRGLPARLYRYDLRARSAERLEGTPQQGEMQRQLEAFLQTATKSLLDNTTGATATKADAAR